MTDLVPVQRPDNHLARLLATFIEGKRAGSPHTADAYHRDTGQRLCHFQGSGPPPEGRPTDPTGPGVVAHLPAPLDRETTHRPKETEMTTYDPDTCERIFHAALAAGDIKGVEAALTVMAPQDPHRAQRLLDMLHVGLALTESRTTSTTPAVVRRRARPTG